MARISEGHPWARLGYERHLFLIGRVAIELDIHPREYPKDPGVVRLFYAYAELFAIGKRRVFHQTEEGRPSKASIGSYAGAGDWVFDFLHSLNSISRDLENALPFILL